MALPKLTKRPSEYQIDETWYENYSPAIKYGARINAGDISSPDDIIGAPVSVEDTGVPVGIANILNFEGFIVTDTGTVDYPEITISTGVTASPIEETFTGFSGVNITLANVPMDEFRLFKNGVLQSVAGSDYTIVGASITLTVSAVTTDIYTALYNINASTSGYTDDTQTGVTGVVITLPSTPTSELRVFKNGVLQVKGNDYTIAGAVITFTVALVATDIINSLYIA